MKPKISKYCSLFHIISVTALALFATACEDSGVTMLDCERELGIEFIAIPETPLFIQKTEVTYHQFAQFVKETNYITLAERVDPDFPEMKLGSAVFEAPSRAKPDWWRLDQSANWLHRKGNNVQAEGVGFSREYPVVHIAYEDASSYAEWIGGRLPTLKEWRLAALGGEEWDWVTPPPEIANTWQGIFPLFDDGADGKVGLAPVRSFPPNSLGLYDMIGNVWEWTSSPSGKGSTWIAGGSYLCDVDFCNNGSPFGKQSQEMSFSAEHIGFRVIFDKKVLNCLTDKDRN